MKLKFEARVAQKHNTVKLSETQKYRNLVVKWDEQYYSVRCNNSLAKSVSDLRLGQLVVIDCHTFSQPKYNHATANTTYNVMLIADAITPVAKNEPVKMEVCACGFPMLDVVQNGTNVKYCANCG